MNLYEYLKQNDRLPLLLEWDMPANTGLDPKELAPSSKKKVAWVCQKGHRWRASVLARAKQEEGCPFCMGQRPVLGQTDLETTRPELAALWNPKNPISPRDVLPSSHRVVWWRCANGHEWKAAVYSVNSGSGCPYCSRYRAAAGETDLATTDPDMLAEWDYERNTLTPQEVSRGSRKRIWWRCPEGHSYQQIVFSKSAGNGCPYCTGKKVLAGFNDLQTTNPELCKEWDTEKNRVLPTQVNRGSHKSVWWICELGHSYEAPIYSKVAGSGCPYCTGRKVLTGFNDLATTHPKVAAQWAQEYNGEVTPKTVSKGSNQKVWWRCSEGHLWQAVVFSRTRKKASDCPICAGQVRLRYPGRYIRQDAVRNRISPREPISLGATEHAAV